MKKLNKILIVILALVAMFSFAMFTACDCGGNTGDGSGQTQTPGGSGNQQGGSTTGGTIYEVIKFDKEEVTMVVGDETYLLARSTSYSELPITYSSSDPSVVSIDALGRAVAHKKGQAKIIASSGSFKAECKVNVTHGNLKPSLNVYGLISDSYTVPMGTTYALNYEVLFNGKKYENVTLTTSLSNSNVRAQVEGNVVNLTGLTKGETELTVKATWDGVSNIPSMEKTVTIKVIGYVTIAINGGLTSEVYIANKVLNTVDGQTSMSAEFVIDVNGTSNEPTVEIENPAIASYANGVITGEGELGSTNAIVSVVNEDGETFSLTVPVNCKKAVGDYMEDGDYKVVDFNTLIGDIDLDTIFNASNVQLVEAWNGYTKLIVDKTGKKIKAGIEGKAFGEPDPIFVTLYSNDEGYKVKIKPYVFKDAIEYATDYQFSCIDGLFFDGDFKLVDIENVLGADKKIGKAYLMTENGQQELKISDNGDTILGLDLNGSQLADYYMAVASDEGMVYIRATGYSLIIDEMKDFSYFYVPDGTWSYLRDKRWSITSGMEWDGYYVLANDLDYQPNNPDRYKHKGYETPSVHLGWSNNLTYGTFGSVGAKQTEEHFGTYGLVGKGLTGIFDGRGHVIDGYMNESWTAKNDIINSAVDKILAQYPTEANQETAKTYKEKGINAVNGGLFQIVNGAIIRNVGFTNARLAQSSGVFSFHTLNGAQIENVYVHVDPAYSYNKTGKYGAILHGTVSKSVIHRNVVVVNDNDKINERANGVFGQSASEYAKGAANWSDVYVISGAPIYGSCFKGTDKDGKAILIPPFASYDSQYLDGVEQKVVTDKINNILEGVRRYTTMDKFVADADNVASSIATFDSSIWTLLDGVVPVFKNAINTIKANELEFYVGNHLVDNSNGNDIAYNQATPITANYLGLPFDCVDSITITSGDEIVKVEGSNVVALAFGQATAHVTYTFNGTTLETDVTLNVVPVVDPVILINGKEIVDNTTKLMLGSSLTVSMLSGTTPVEDIEVAPKATTDIITVNGTTITASNTIYGAVDVVISVNGGEYEFSVVVERPEVYANGINLSTFATALEVGQTTAITLKYNGADLAGNITLTPAKANVSVDGTTIKGVEVGETDVTVTIGEISFTITIYVMDPPEHSYEYAFSAYDGKFFSKDLSGEVSIGTIFGDASAQIVSVKDASGKFYNVTELGYILGVETTKEVGEIELTLYSNVGSIKVKADTYTLIIDKVEDLDYFTLDGNVTLTTDQLSYDGDDWNWDGYYVLANDIDAKGYAHVSSRNPLPDSIQTAKTEIVAKTKFGFSGVFDGLGHKIENLYVAPVTSQTGLGLFGYINGGTVKNVAFENIYSGQYGAYGKNAAYTNCVAAPFANVLVNGAKLQDMYISTYHLGAASAYVLFANADNTSKVERVVTQDNYNTTKFGTWGGYIVGQESKAILSEVYVIDQKPITTGGRVGIYIKSPGDNAKAGDEIKPEQYADGQRVAADAVYVDGKENSSTTISYFYKAGDIATKYDLINNDGIEYYDGTKQKSGDVYHYYAGDTLYTPYEINLLSGVKRYTSVAAMEADKANNDFSSWDSNLWEIVNGAPVFVSTIANEFTAFINGVAKKDGDSLQITAKDVLNVKVMLGGAEISGVPTLKVVDGAEFVSVNGTTITAVKASGDNNVSVKISYRDASWTINLKIYDKITPIEWPTEYYYSAHDGNFYDDDFNVVSIDEILGKDVDIVRGNDEQGNFLTLNDLDQIVDLDLGKQSTWAEKTLTVYTETEGLSIRVKAADLIINELADLSYFTLDGNVTYTKNTSLEYDGNDWNWDGYHVLVKDLDARDTAFVSLKGTYTNATAKDSTAIQDVPKTVVASTNFGLSGVFDGQGHTIENLYVAPYSGQNGLGLFGFVNGGTIKNVAFESLYTHQYAPYGEDNPVYTGVVHSPFANVLVNGAKIQDVYASYYRLGGSSAYKLFRDADDTSSVERVMVKDNYNGTAFATWGSNVFGSGSQAKVSELYVIDVKPIVTGSRVTVYTHDTTQEVPETGAEVYSVSTYQKISSDAAYLNGQPNSPTYNFLHAAGQLSTKYDLTNTAESYYSTTSKKVDNVTHYYMGELLYTPYTINLLEGVKRYSSVADMTADADNNKFDSWSSDIWTVVSGIPCFTSSVLKDAKVYVKDVEIVDNDSHEMVVGETLKFVVKHDGKELSSLPTVTVNAEAESMVSISGSTVTAAAPNGSTTVTITVAYNGATWTQNLVIYDDITATEYGTELYFSAHDGKFYDSNFNVVSVDTIFAGDVDVTRAYDAEGNAVALGDNDELLNVDLGAQSTWKDTEYTLYTADAGLIIKVKAADAILDDVTDLSCLQVQEETLYEGGAFKFGEGQFAFDGYYVLAKDIDGANYGGEGVKYSHKVTNGLVKDSSAKEYNLSARGIDEIEDRTDGRGFKVNGEIAHGFMGTFDGRGYAIKNVEVDRDGLFGAILGGTLKNLAVINCGNDSSSTIAFSIGAGATLDNIYVENSIASGAVSMSHAEIARGIKTATLNNVVVKSSYRSSDLNTAITQLELGYTVYAGSVGVINATQTTVNGLYVISILPLSMTKYHKTAQTNANEWVTVTDGAYIDGSANAEASAIAGAKRYTSVAAMEADKKNNDFSSWNSDIWEVANGVPTFLSTLTGEYTAYLNDVAVSAEDAKEIVVDETLTATIKLDGKTVSAIPQVEIIAGGEYITASGATITGKAMSGANTVTVKITYRGQSWTQNFVVYNNITATEHGVEYYFSAHDGKFYDSNFNVVSVDTIFGGDVDVIRAFDAEGNAVVLGDNDELLNVDLGANDTWKETRFTLYTADAGLIIKVKAADLIIDDLADLSYFTLDGNVTYTKNTSLVYDGDDWNWDGYHVLVKDLDARDIAFVSLTGTYTNATDKDTTGLQDVPKTVVASTNFGLSGVFDGQGHTIENLYVAPYSGQDGLGLFGYVNGGTIKNVAFESLYSHTYAPYGGNTGDKYTGVVHSPFANVLVNGAKIQDVYASYYRLGGSSAYKLFRDADSTSSVERVVVKDNYNVTAFATWGSNVFGSGSQATVSELYVIDQKPVVTGGRVSVVTRTYTDAENYTDSSAATLQKISGDAAYVDGVAISSTYNYFHKAGDLNPSYDLANTEDNVEYLISGAVQSPYTINLLEGAKRYSSLDKMKADKANNDFSAWDNGVWEIIDGVPTIYASMDTKELKAFYNTAFADGEIAENSAISLYADQTVNYSVTLNGEATSFAPSVEIVSGDEIAELDGLKLSAISTTTAGSVVVKISYKDASWTQTVTFEALPEDFGTEYYFSAYDGQFFNDSYEVVSLETIFGAETTIDSVKDAGGNVLTVEGGKILGLDLGKQSTWTETYLVVTYTANEETVTKKVNITAADAIIDEATDFEALTLFGNLAITSTSISYEAPVDGNPLDNFIFDGYYVVVKDIDASAYAHTSAKTPASNALYSLSLDVAKASDYGFSGVFDGQGHTISKMLVQNENGGQTGFGIFGLVNGGTIKNVAFDNLYSHNKSKPSGATLLATGVVQDTFATLLVNGAKIQDVYISYYRLAGSSKFLLFHTADNTSSVERVVVQDVYGGATPSNPSGNFGGFFWSTSAATHNDVYLISPVPVSTGNSSTRYIVTTEGGAATKTNINLVTGDAAYVDGNEVSTTCDYIILRGDAFTRYSLTDTTDTVTVYTDSAATTEMQSYTISVYSGVKRYTTPEKMTADAKNNNFASWSESIWTITNGIPTMHALVQA